MQGVLIAAAVLQGAAAAAKHDHPGARFGAVAPSALAVQEIDPLVVVREAPPRGGDAPADATSVDSAATPKARALARKYRAKGYPVSPSLAESIHDAAVESGIAPEVAFGLVRTESAFKASATSHVGAIGLTQLMPTTARWLEPGTTRSDLRDPDTNLRIGFRYLHRLIERYDGDTRLALLAYNRGPGTVDRVLKRGGDPDNGYADMVLDR